MAPYHGVLNCYANTMTLALPGVPKISLKGVLHPGSKRIMSYVQARRLVERGCLSYLAYICDTSVISPTFLDFVRVI